MTDVYALDTSIVIEVLRGRNAALTDRFDALLRERKRFVLSTVVLHELEVGIALNAQPQRQRARLDAFFRAPVEIAAFDAAHAREAAHIRAALRRSGGEIGPYDVLIAGHARAEGLTLATGARREFMRVERLRLADWA